jgi:hypothetical protein
VSQVSVRKKWDIISVEMVSPVMYHVVPGDAVSACAR